MKPRDLWELMAEILRSCLDKSEVRDPDVVVNDALMACATLEDVQEALVRDAISGTLHFEKVCEGMLKGFCDFSRRNGLDRCSMYLIAYFTVFRYEIVGSNYLREMFYRSTTTNVLIEYLEYMTDPKGITECSCAYWNNHYDSSFVENYVCRALQNVAASVRQEIVEWLRAKVPGGVVPVHPVTEEQVEHCAKPMHTSTSAPITGVPPLVPTQQRRPTLPPAEVREMMFVIPEERPARIDCTKPPLVTRLPPKALTVPMGFSFLNRPPLSLRKKAHEWQNAESVVAPSARQPYEVKALLDKPVEVRMTAGAVRREALVYMKKEEERKRALTEVEVTLHDAREYDDWRERERKREELERVEEINRRKGEIKQVAENAVESRKAVEESKKAATRKVKSERESAAEAYAAQKELWRAQRQSLVIQKRQDHLERRERAMQRLNRSRFTAAARLRSEMERRKEEAMEDQEKEREERLATIREMQDLRERNRRLKEERMLQNFAERGGVHQSCISNAMSNQELKEELRRLKLECANLEKERRAEFQARRQKERENLEALRFMCAEQRQCVRRTRIEELAIKGAQKAALEEAQNDEIQRKAQVTCEVLKQKRNAKRAEQLSFARENRTRQNKMVLLAKDAHTVEETRWKELERGVINRITQDQNRRLNSVQV